MYLHRYVRVMPLFAYLMLLMLSLLKYTGNGPYASRNFNYLANCQKYWWTNLIYIANYYNPHNVVSLVYLSYLKWAHYYYFEVYCDFMVSERGFSACSYLTIDNVPGLQIWLEIFMGFTDLHRSSSNLDIHRSDGLWLQSS